MKVDFFKFNPGLKRTNGSIFFFLHYLPIDKNNKLKTMQKVQRSEYRKKENI